MQFFFDLLVCTLFGSEAATQITLPGLKQHFRFYSVLGINKSTTWIYRQHCAHNLEDFRTASPPHCWPSCISIQFCWSLSQLCILRLHVTKCSLLISTYLLLGTGLIPVPSYSLYGEVIFQTFCHFQIVQSGKSYNSKKKNTLPIIGLLNSIALLGAYFLPVET